MQPTYIIELIRVDGTIRQFLKFIRNMRAKKIDDNQNLIVKELRRCGVSVAITSMVGNGFVDIVCGFRGKNFLIELKDGAKSASRKQLTPDEIKFFSSWNGQVNKAESFNEIKLIIGL